MSLYIEVGKKQRLMVQCNGCQIAKSVKDIYLTNHNLDNLFRDNNYKFIIARTKGKVDWIDTQAKSLSVRKHWHLCESTFLCSTCFIIKDIIE
jgi:hypothetical protein